MKKLRILHTADLHMDSPFEALSAVKASVRRGEQRDLLGRIAALANDQQADLVLFSGDLLDSDNTFYETGEVLIRALRQIRVPVFIAPGNHDFYSERSPYARLKLPENIHIFSENEIRCVDLPGLGMRVYGAAFTEDDGKTFHFLPAGTIVSMNMWGFTPDILAEIQGRFAAFLRENLPLNPLKCEYFLPLIPNPWAYRPHLVKTSPLDCFPGARCP